MSLDTRRTRHGGCVCACRRRDRRMHDEVGGARSARRLARGSALARRALPLSALTEPSRRCNARGAVMSLARRRIRRRARASTVRPARARRGRRRSAGATTRSGLGACSASPVSVLREPSRRCDEESSSSQQAASSSSQQQAASSSSSSKQQRAAAASSSKQRQQAAAASSSKQQQAAAASSSKQHDDVGRREARRPERLTPIPTARPLRRCPYDGDSSLRRRRLRLGTGAPSDGSGMHRATAWA